MATFPRTILPNTVKPAKVPGGLVSVGTTGGVQLRGNVRAGRTWDERWHALVAGSTNVELLIAFVEEHYNKPATFDILHQLLPGCGKAPNGAGGGTPLVVGSSEAGDSIATDGWPNSTTVMRRGDCFKLNALNQLFRVITADVVSNGSGVATVQLNPPILVGSSPANNAALSLTGNTMRAIVVDYDLPDVDASEFVSMRVRFLEAP